MYKLFFVFSIFVASAAFAQGNALCDSKPSNSSYCKTAAQAMYQGYLQGYIDAVVQNKQENHQPINKKKIKEEAQQLISYNEFYTGFQKCGEAAKNDQEAKKCITVYAQRITLGKILNQLGAKQQ